MKHRDGSAPAAQFLQLPQQHMSASNVPSRPPRQRCSCRFVDVSPNLATVKDMKFAHLLLVVFCAALLTACQSTIGTNVSVGTDAKANITISVRFDGSIAEELRKRPGLVDSLEKAFESRGLRPDHRSDNGSEIWTAELGTVDPVVGPDTIPAGPVADKVAATADVTGVAIVAVERRDSNALVKVATVDPAGLRQALKDAIGEAPDAGVLYETYIANTTTAVAVTFPGSIKNPGSFTTTSSNRGVLSIPLDQAGTASYSILGSLDGNADSVRLAAGIVAAIVALTATVAVVRSRR